jgi:hypothetical protein
MLRETTEPLVRRKIYSLAERRRFNDALVSTLGTVLI